MMQTEFSLVRKVSLVTGSAHGIGFAVAKALGRAGSDLILVDRLAQEPDWAVQTIARDTERKVLAVPADLARHEDARILRRLSRIPLSRAGDARDAAGTVVFFSSSVSGYVTGQVLSVDGGWLSA
jgi:NAD(P)-dependent dehydrogenase (short-subunit alcohol dehydrogenase family)